MPRIKNPRLKKPNISLEYTVDKIAELERCLDDPCYFIKNYVYIKHPVKGKVLFNLFDYQENIIKNYQNNEYTIILSARQTGKTETSCAYLLWFAMFFRERTAFIVSNKLKNAKETISRIQFMYEELPDWLKCGIDESSWNKGEAAFENNSRIIAEATTADSGRGYPISLLYCDELAFVKPSIQEEFFAAIMPTLSPGSKCVVSSTPNGDTNLFSQMWRRAEAGLGQFKPIYVPWHSMPGRDEEFKRKKIEDIGIRRWNQEYECKFLSSEATLIDTTVLDLISKDVLKTEPVFVKENIPFFKKIDPNSTYIFACDPAEGTGNDFSTFELFEFPSMEQVMEYRSNTTNPRELYLLMRTIIKWLEKLAKDVYFSVESNSVGQAIIALYESDDDLPDSPFISEPGKNRLGFLTSNHTVKMKYCMKLKDMLEANKIKIHSTDLIIELKNYVRSRGAYAAQVGATDDLISALLIVIRILEVIASYDDAAYSKIHGFDDIDQTEWEIDDGEYEAGLPVII